MSNVPYSCARAKVLEKTLLGTDRINRMIDSGSPEEAIKILSEVNFGGGLTLSSCIDFEKLIRAEEDRFIAFIREACPSIKLKSFFLKKYDYHNAQTILRSKYLEFDTSAMITRKGLISIECLKDGILSDDYRDFPKQMQTALSDCDNKFVSGTATGAIVGGVFLRAYFDDLYCVCRTNTHLKEIYKAEVDATNITTALRSRDFSFCQNHFIPHGSLSEKDLRILCEGQFENIRSSFRYSVRKDMIFSAIASAEKNLPFSEFERVVDEFAVSYLNKYKYETSGILPFIQYCFYKLADIFNVRIILAGLINGVTGSEIKERLRKGYAG